MMIVLTFAAPRRFILWVYADSVLWLTVRQHRDAYDGLVYEIHYWPRGHGMAYLQWYPPDDVLRDWAEAALAR